MNAAVSPIVHDLAAAERFLRLIDPAATAWSFQTFDDSGAERGWLTQTLHGTLEQHAGRLAEQNLAGAGVYVTINQTNLRGRKATDIQHVRAIWVDIDKVRPDTLEQLANASPAPSVIVTSSPGKYHAYWLVAPDAVPLEDFRSTQEALIERWDSDTSIKDLPRVMRLPGFAHRKHHAAHPVKIIKGDPLRYGAELVIRAAPVPVRRPATAATEPPREVSRYAQAALQRAYSAVEGAPEGTRNATLNKEAFGVLQLAAAGELPEDLAVNALEVAASAAGLDDGEISRTIASAKAAADKSPRAAPAPQPRLNPAEIFKNAGSVPDAPNTHLVPVDIADIQQAKLEEIGFSIRPWFPRRHVTLLGGHGGIGKSTLALAASAHVACGLSFAGLTVEASSVLFVSLEDEASIVCLRLRRIIEHYNLPVEAVLANLRIVDGTKGIGALITAGDGFGVPPTFTPVFDELVKASEGAGLIVIDNASDAFEANENSRREVRTFIRGLAALARNRNASVVLLAHIDKAAAKGAGMGNNYSGSTAWHNSARSRLALVEEDGRIEVRHEKCNLSRRADPLPITLSEHGVPIVGSLEASQASDSAQAVGDIEIMISVLLAASQAGLSVPDNLTPGAHSAMKALEPLPEYTPFTGSRGGRRAASAITALKRDGRLRPQEYTKPNRHRATRLVLCAEKCAASPPHPLEQ